MNRLNLRDFNNRENSQDLSWWPASLNQYGRKIPTSAVLNTCTHTHMDTHMRKHAHEHTHHLHKKIDTTTQCIGLIEINGAQNKRMEIWPSVVWLFLSVWRGFEFLLAHFLLACLFLWDFLTLLSRSAPQAVPPEWHIAGLLKGALLDRHKLANNELNNW